MKICEIIDPNVMLRNAMLSDFQKKVLILTAISATPTQALDSTVGNLNLVAARDLLHKLGYITMSANELTLTDLGDEALTRNNLTDNGQPTEEGNRLLSNDDNLKPSE